MYPGKSVFFIFFLFFAVKAFAQNNILEGQVIDGRNNHLIPLASVTLTSLQDSAVYRQLTDADGKFRMNGIGKPGNYVLSVQKTGYAGFIKIVELETPLEHTGNIIMIDSAHLLHETIVKTKRNAIRVSGDTIEYNSAYYKTNPDMDAVYLISKLPGIDLKSKTANGDSISKFMINGIVIFNDAPEKILAQLPAGVIEKIQVYNDTGEAGNMGMLRAKQVKILNVKTNDGYLTHFKGKLYAGYAADDYFLAGFNTMKQTGGVQISISGSTNRGGIRYDSYYDPTSQFRSNGIPLISELNFNYSKPLNKRDQLSIDYSVRDNYTEVRRKELYQYDLETSNDFLENSSSRKYNLLSNAFNLKWTRTKANSNKVILYSSISIANGHNNDSDNVHSEIGGNSILALNETVNKKNDYNGRIGLNFFNNKKKNTKSVSGISYAFALHDEHATNNGFTGSPDTNYTTRYLNIAGTLSNTTRLFFSSEMKTTDKNLVSINIESEDRFVHSDQQKKLYSDTTHDYTIHDLQYSNAIDYALSKNMLTVKENYNFKNKKTVLEAGSNLQHMYISSPSGFSKNYLGINPFINFVVRYSNLEELNMSLAKANELPLFDQLNPVFNTTSAYFYTVGNLGLQPADRYSFSVSYKNQLFKEGNFFRTDMSLIYIEKNIAETTLIPTASDVNVYGKIIPVGSLLASYQNIDEYKYLRYAASYDMPLSIISTVWKLKAVFEAKSSNSLLNDLTINTTSYNYTTSSTFASVISTKIDFSLYAAYNYNRSVQTNQSELRRDLQQYQLNALFTAQLDKRQSIKTEADLNIINGLSETDTKFYLVDFSYQVKALRDKKLMLTITLHDLFNSYKNYNYEYQYNSKFGNSANTIYSSYTSHVGRYLLFLLSYNI